ncbi:MAG: S8 family peptidase [Deltaproteobacteria bacterium]|nr:S8 family peptidase [Deltaproteobacteria bacterium]
MLMRWLPRKPRILCHCAALIVGVVLVPLGSPTRAASPEVCSTHASSYSFVNNTQQPTHGIHLNLLGPQSISQVYLGDRNPFGEPEWQALGPNGIYRFRFASSTIAPEDTVQIAFCGVGARVEAVPLGNSNAASWLAEGEGLPQARPVPIAGHRLVAESRGGGTFHLTFEVNQSEALDLRLEEVEIAFGEPRSLADLSYQTSSDLSWNRAEPSAINLPGKPSNGDPSRIFWDTFETVRWDDPRAFFLRFQTTVAGEPEGPTETVLQVDLDTFLQPIFFREQAVAAANSRFGRGDLEVVHNAPMHLPLTGRDAIAFKLQDGDGKIYSVTLDRDGAEVSGEELIQAEGELEEQTFGKLESLLWTQLSAAEPDEPLRVSFWLKLPEPNLASSPQRPHSSTTLTERELDLLQVEIDHFQAQRVAAVTAPFLDRLTTFAPEAVSTGTDLAPLVHTSLLPAAIKTVATWEEVDRVYGEQIHRPDLNGVRTSVQSFVPHGLGIDGTGQVLGVLEVGGAISSSNPFLPNVVQNSSFACLEEHGTGVAGVIASNHGTHTGMAPGASLRVAGSCGGFDSELEAGAAWQVSQGARALNLSFGANGGTHPGSSDRFYDSLSINNARTIVTSAGNNGGDYGDGSGQVSSPARGYNLISVGNYNDRNNGAPNKMSESSSFVDPASTLGDREKPELAAPGNNLTSTTNSSPWVDSGFSGTSFSAPVVTGAAGLLFDANPSLQIWPEAVKAILMATATNNIEGNTRLSDQDGAGGIRLDQAVAAAGFGQNSQWIASSLNCDIAADQTIHTIDLIGGRWTRVVFSWGQPTNYIDYEKHPSADFDLKILAPNATIQAKSTSFDNNYEIVEFLAPMDGAYLVQIDPVRCDQSPQTMGLAWWQNPILRTDGLGHDGEGAGMALVDLNSNGQPDMILMAYDAPNGVNQFKYKIGWDLDSLGQASSWSGSHAEAGVGHTGEGAGAEVAYIDANLQADLILVAYDAPSGVNEFRYKIGWNLDSNGKASSWSGIYHVGGVGFDGDGASLEIGDLNNNGIPDLILMAYDDPAGQNEFRYQVGLDLNPDGKATSWTPVIHVGGVGHTGHGAGVTLGNLDNDSRPEMILMAYDAPPGLNSFRYRIGWNINPDGQTVSWSPSRYVSGLGWEGDGADLELFDIDSDGLLDLLLMAYDDPPGNNVFKYVVVDP